MGGRQTTQKQTQDKATMSSASQTLIKSATSKEDLLTPPRGFPQPITSYDAHIYFESNEEGTQSAERLRQRIIEEFGNDADKKEGPRGVRVYKLWDHPIGK